MAISYKRILITTFYEYIKDKLVGIGKPVEAIAFDTISGTLNMPIKELMRKRVVVVSQNSFLRDVLKELREKEAEVIIVEDEEHNILGVVDPSAILNILERKG